MHSPIDLRSDTVTRPDPGMLAAMTGAPLGDDVFGDDPTVQALEIRAASATGKEEALFVPSGTMANSIAIGVQTRPGDEIVLEELCHSYNFECAGAARLWGVQARPLAGTGGRIPLEAIEAAIRPTDIHLPRTSLLILEQTSNVAGGCVLPLEYLQAAGALCKREGLRFHLDGARVFNASVASGVPVADYAACADTVMFCISKGLGAPVGSLLAGSGELIERARAIRKVLGGGMRQAGLLAACGLYALENNVERLQEDHRRARELAGALSGLAARGLDVGSPETNMVYLRWPGEDPQRYLDFVNELKGAGVLAATIPRRGVRLVLHKDVDDEDLGRAAEVVKGCLARRL
jgi:threonine aldolase